MLEKFGPLLILFIASSVLPERVKHSKTTEKCEKLNIPLCKQLKWYEDVHYPNILKVKSQQEARQQMRTFLPLLKDKKCEASLKPFLCLLYAPPCSPGVKHPVPPCRQICTQARSACQEAHKKMGGIWPNHFKCSHFPEGGVCAGLDQNFPIPAPYVSKTMTEVMDYENKRLDSIQQKETKNTEDPKQPPETAFKYETKRLKGNPKYIFVQNLEVQQDDNLLEQSENSLVNTDENPKLQISENSKKDVQYTKKMEKNKITAIKPRRYDIDDLGNPALFRGWVDVQGQGAANDYCRVIGKQPKQQFLACALAGSTSPNHMYVSMRGFDTGLTMSWYMKDMDGDGRDDYCRCIGEGEYSRISCMKAGENGFYGSIVQPGNQYSFTVPMATPCAGKLVNPFLGN